MGCGGVGFMPDKWQIGRGWTSGGRGGVEEREGRDKEQDGTSGIQVRPRQDPWRAGRGGLGRGVVG